MTDQFTPEGIDFLLSWGITFAIAGAACAALGSLVGWIIWRNTRKVAEAIEAGNRDAFADYENMSDEVSRIRAELSGSKN